MVAGATPIVLSHFHFLRTREKVGWCGARLPQRSSQSHSQTAEGTVNRKRTDYSLLAPQECFAHYGGTFVTLEEITGTGVKASGNEVLQLETHWGTYLGTYF